MTDPDLLTAMYQDDAPETRRPVAPVSAESSRTRRVMVGAIGYDLPTVEYVARLEQMVMKQATQIEEMRREMLNFDRFLKSTRNFIRRQTGQINDVHTRLDTKLDATRREF